MINPTTLAAKIDARLHDCAAPARTAIIAEVIEAVLRADSYCIVPVEPTKEMVVAGNDKLEECKDSDWDSGPDGESYNSYTTIESDAPAQIYRAMIAAAGSDA